MMVTIIKIYFALISHEHEHDEHGDDHDDIHLDVPGKIDCSVKGEIKAGVLCPDEKKHNDQVLHALP